MLPESKPSQSKHRHRQQRDTQQADARNHLGQANDHLRTGSLSIGREQDIQRPCLTLRCKADANLRQRTGNQVSSKRKLEDVSILATAQRNAVIEPRRIASTQCASSREAPCRALCQAPLGDRRRRSCHRRRQSEIRPRKCLTATADVAACGFASVQIEIDVVTVDLRACITCEDQHQGQQQGGAKDRAHRKSLTWSVSCRARMRRRRVQFNDAVVDVVP